MKNDKILNVISIVINCIITYVIANNRCVNRMPVIDGDYSFVEDLYELFLGHGLTTVIIAFITVFIIFVINKLIMKQEVKLKKYIYLFIIMFILNIIVYRIGIGVAV